MTLDEARIELGVTKDATNDAVRRAYLRLLKTRKPEVDPEGFRRLRDAYEICRAAPRFDFEEEPAAEFEAALARVVHEDAEEHTKDEPAIDGPAKDEPASDEPANDEPAKDEPANDEPANDEPAIDEPAPVPEVVAREPEPGFMAAYEIAQLIERGKLKSASKGVRERLDAAGSSMDVAVPPPWTVIDLILALYAEGSFKSAKALAQSFRRWLQDSGAESQLLTGALAAQWVIVRELGEIGAIDSQIHAAIAAAARAGDIESARPKLHRVRIADEVAARESAHILQMGAPTLAPLLVSALYRTSDRVAPPEKKSSAFKWIYVSIAIACLRGFSALSGACSHSDPPRDAYSPPPAYTPTTTVVATGPEVASWADGSAARIAAGRARRDGGMK